MNKIELSEASEDEFIDVVRAAIRSNGRSRFIEVMVDEEDGDDIVANENNDFLNSASNMSDDSDDESENDDGGSDAEDDNDSIESAENDGDKVSMIMIASFMNILTVLHSRICRQLFVVHFVEHVTVKILV